MCLSIAGTQIQIATLLEANNSLEIIEKYIPLRLIREISYAHHIHFNERFIELIVSFSLLTPVAPFTNMV